MIIISLWILWSVLSLFFGTAVVAVREVSRTQLLAIMKRIGKEDRIEIFDRHAHEYMLTAMLFRQLTIVLFVITAGMSMPPTQWNILQPLQVLVVSVAWFILFGIAIPTAWARHAGEAYIARTLGLLELLRRVNRPILAVIHAVDEIVRRLAGAPRDSGDPTEEMEQEILDAVSQAETTGAVGEAERAMIKSAMVLDETSVAEIMTPRTDMIGLDVSATFVEIRELVLEEGHSRLPIYEETLDHIIGILHIRDLLRIDKADAFSLKNLMRPATYVPETKDLASLLHEFQSNRVHMAIVLDEYGGTAGLVTIEDILEELVGDIADEHDETPMPSIERINEHTADLDARVRVDEVNDELSIQLPEDEAYDTIGGFVISKLGRIPPAGDILDTDGVKLEVLQAEPRCINRLRIHLPHPPKTED